MKLFILISSVNKKVASFAEAWIEIISINNIIFWVMSPPSRRRGLKYSRITVSTIRDRVASFAEAWIEISISVSKLK